MTDFAAPAQKYTGKLKINGGPVPIKTWRGKEEGNRPITLQPRGDDLRAERKAGVK